MIRKPSRLRYFTSGIVLENPLLVLMIGLCPALATTATARDGFGMGIAASFVLICSNIVVSLIRRWVPSSIRIPIFIVIISSFVTIADYALYQVLGIFIPLIVVNCIILGRAEGFAYNHGLFDSVLDALGKAVGFTFALGLMGIIRELFAAGTVFGVPVTPAGFRDQPVLFMIFPPGAFLLIGVLKSIINKLTARKGT
jgi:electron transport complex protein RnfE